MTDHAPAARAARRAAHALATTSAETRNVVILDLARAIESHASDVLAANAADIEAALAAGVDEPKRRRLLLTHGSLAQMCDGLRQIAGLPDPVGRVTRDDTVPSGLRVQKVRCPLGVIAMIYEARPGVTIDAFALCFKAGNACLLKGGREAVRSNEALAAIARGVLVAHGLPPESITLITTADRDELRGLLALSGLIDLVIPRGGEGLIAFVAEHSRIPIVKHDRGVCHVYVDADADLNMAIEIIVNGKTSAPATCNTTECVLIHEAVAPALVPKLADRLHAEGVTIHADERFRGMAHTANTVPATEGDWGREYLALALAVRVVADLGIAIEHIARYTSNHTEAIITENHAVAERFLGAVQSSCVLVNASTRFNDGYQLGLGAEIGISTSKIHAYGPMGLEGLTAERYIVRGSGQIR